MHDLVVGTKYIMSPDLIKPDVEVILEAIGRGDGLICIRWNSGRLQLVRGDILSLN